MDMDKILLIWLTIHPNKLNSRDSIITKVCDI